MALKTSVFFDFFFEKSKSFGSFSILSIFLLGVDVGTNIGLNKQHHGQTGEFGGNII